MATAAQVGIRYAAPVETQLRRRETTVEADLRVQPVMEGAQRLTGWSAWGAMGVGILVFLVGFAGDWDGIQRSGLFGDRKERKKSVGGHAVMYRFSWWVFSRCNDYRLDGV